MRHRSSPLVGSSKTITSRSLRTAGRGHALAFAARKRHRCRARLSARSSAKHLGKARFVFPIRSTGADDYVGLRALPESWWFTSCITK